MGLEKGYTLIEVVVSLGLLTIGLLGVLLFGIIGIKGNLYSKELSLANELAEKKMEMLLSLGYENPLLEDSDGDGEEGLSDTDSSDVDHFDEENPLYGKFYVFWNVAENFPEQGMKTLRVFVRWIRGGREHRISVSSCLLRE